MEYIKRMKDFLLTYPNTTPWTELQEFDFIDFDPGLGGFVREGDAIVPAGDTIISSKKSITGRETHRKRLSFGIVMRRNTIDNTQREAIAVFAPQFVDWINLQNGLRNTPDRNPALPKFSMTQYEKIIADGGYRTRILETTAGAIGEFTVTVHSEFEIVYYYGR